MPGAIPKPREERVDGRVYPSEMTYEADPILEAPPLPSIDIEWHPNAVAYWEEIWQSPFISELITVDIHGLYIFITLVNQFWHKPEVKLGNEIRMQRRSFGLTPEDRARMRWEKEKKRASGVAPVPTSLHDPRSLLEE